MLNSPKEAREIEGWFVEDPEKFGKTISKTPSRDNSRSLRTGKKGMRKRFLRNAFIRAINI